MQLSILPQKNWLGDYPYYADLINAVLVRIHVVGAGTWTKFTSLPQCFWIGIEFWLEDSKSRTTCSRTLINIMGECFANEIVQWCRKCMAWKQCNHYWIQTTHYWVVNCLYEPYSQAASDGKPGTRARLCLYSEGVPVLIKNPFYMGIWIWVQLHNFKLFSFGSSTIYTCSEKQGSRVAPMQVSMVRSNVWRGRIYRAQLYRTDILPAHLPTLILV